MPIPKMRSAAAVLAAVLLSGVSASAVPVRADNLRPVPKIVTSSRADLLNPDGSVKLSSPYLAGVGGTPAYSGVGTIVVSSDVIGPDFVGLCTASLVAPNVVMTAAHCVRGPNVGHVETVNFYLPNGRPYYGADPAPNPGVPQMHVGSAYVTSPLWNNNALSGDVALIKLETPVTGADIYQIYRGDPLGQEVTIVGTGTGGWGDVGADSETGYPGGLFDLRKRVGGNIYEEWAIPFFEAINNQLGIDIGLAGDPNSIIMYDFDSGLAQNDVFGSLSGFSDPSLSSLNVSQTGLPNEVGTASGDSGGPIFINGQIAGITSWGITGAILSFDGTFIYCGGPNDIDVSFDVDTGSCTDSSFGEIDGNTNVAYYQNFIDAVLAGQVRYTLVPEPATFALLFAGLASIGAIRRKKR